MKKTLIFMAFFGGLLWLGLGEAGTNQEADTTLVDSTQVSYPLEPIVITPTRYPQPLSQAPPNLTTITSGQIDRIGAENLGKILGLCPGIELIRTGGYGQVDSLRIRGSTPQQVLFLMNGWPLNNPRNGGLDLNLIPISSVERVEVIRGGLSSLYGADAVGGVVNIITKSFSYSRPYSRVGFWQGDWGYKRSQFELGRDIGGKCSIYLAGEIKSYDGYRGNSDYKASLFHANLKYKLSKSWQINFYSLNYKGKLGVPGNLDSPTPNARVKDRRSDFSLGLKKFKGNFLEFQLHFSDSWQNCKDPDLNTNSTHKNRVYGLSFQGFPLWPGMGFGGRGERIALWDANIETPDVNRFTLWVEDDLKLSSRLILRGSGRLDYHSAFGYQFSPGVNLSDQIENNLLLFASFERSFRAPTANELYRQSPFISGNPSLRPERGWSYQIGFKGDNGKGNYLTANLFLHRMGDLIEWEADLQPFIEYTAVNKARTEFKGGEVGLGLLPFRSFKVGAVYNLLWAKDLKEGNPLSYRPRNSGRLWLDLSLTLIDGKSSLGFWTEGEWMDSRFTERGSKLSPFFLLNSTLTISFLDLSLYLKGENLSDTSYELRDGYPMSPRSFYGGLTWKFWD